MTATVRDSTRRLDDIDLYRGLCVVMMVVVHVAITLPPVANAVISTYDMVAEGFVTLAGFMVGYHYLPRFGYEPWATTKRLWRRAGEILLLQYGIAAYVGLHLLMARNEPYPGGLWPFIVDTVTLKNQNYLGDILPMFVVFFLASPLLLWLAKKGQFAFLALGSLDLFVLGQFFPFCVSIKPSVAFPAILWQLYFVLGFMGGVARWRAWPPVTPRKAWKGIVFAALFWVALAALPFALWYGAGIAMLQGAWFPNKWPLSAGRVLFLLPEMVFVYYLLYGTAGFLLRRVPGARTLQLIGRHSLFAFAFHVLLIYQWNDLVLRDQLSMQYRLWVLPFFIAALGAATHLWHWRRAKRKPAPAA